MVFEGEINEKAVGLAILKNKIRGGSWTHGYPLEISK